MRDACSFSVPMLYFVKFMEMFLICWSADVPADFTQRVNRSNHAFDLVYAVQAETDDISIRILQVKGRG